MNASSSTGAVPTSARILGAVGRGLMTAGVVVLLFVVFQLWGTNIQEARAQADLRAEFDDVATAARTEIAAFVAAGSPVDATGDVPLPLSLPVTTSTLPGGLTPEVLRYFFPEDGDAVARIEIPSIGVDKIVVNGVQVTDLRKGPGRYPGSATTGTAGNTSIAGHRTTHGAPFNRIDELAPGDEIHVTGLLGRFTYRVMAPDVAFAAELDTVESRGDGHIIVRPSATWVLGDFRDNRVTLTACHPELSSRQRIIVAAELVEAPVDAPALDLELLTSFIAQDRPTLPGEPLDGTGLGESAAGGGPTDVGLDEGLNGERDAIPGAVVWMIIALALWVLAGVFGRRLSNQRRHRVAIRVGILVPVGFCLWFSFEMIDRALPAG